MELLLTVVVVFYSLTHSLARSSFSTCSPLTHYFSTCDKVHEWNFCTSQDAMRYLVTEEWRGAQAEHARLLAAGRRARTPLKRRELLEQQAAVLRRLSKHMPKPQLKYAPPLAR